MRRAGARTQGVVAVLIGALCVGALLTIVLILTNADDGGVGERITQTFLVLGAFGLTGLAGDNLLRRRPLHAGFGYLTMAVAVVAFTVFLVTIWTGADFFDNGKLAPYSLVLALATGHASVLLGTIRPTDTPAIQAVRAGTLAALAALVVILFIDIAAYEDAVSSNLAGVVVVLYLLGTVLHFMLRSVFAAPAEDAAAGDSAALATADHVVVAVEDWSGSAGFYQALGVEARPGHAAVAIAWPGSAASAIEHLTRQGIEVLSAPVPRQGARGEGLSFYVRDPAGRLVELIAYSA